MGAMIDSGPAELFIWSAAHADELAATAREAGWRVLVARGDVGGRVSASGARVAVVDARGAWARALAVAADLGARLRVTGGALVALVAHGEAGALERFLDAGATSFLVEPWSEDTFAAALRFAARHAEQAAAADEAEDLLAADLHDAIGRGEIDVLFQPQVSFATGAIVGVEALARWEHRIFGPLGAEPLFAAAERAGLAAILSAHVQMLALRRAAAWPDVLGKLRLSVNVTPVDLSKRDFATALLRRAADAGFPVDRLTIEVTESGLIAELDIAAGLLGALREQGCRVALDDFGTGYSSLAYLKALPVDYLKLDRSLSQDIAGSPRDRAVVSGIIGIARSLGLAVIAEGVETAEQRDLLAAAGCDLYQGFLCAEAVDEAALVRLVETGDLKVR